MRIITVAGARPNFMKVAPLMEAFRAHPRLEPMLVHTGQHYDERMSDLFFRQLGIPAPDINLGVGSNRLVGTDPSAILAAWAQIQAGQWRIGQVPLLWDGQAAQRIATILGGPR